MMSIRVCAALVLLLVGTTSIRAQQVEWLSWEEALEKSKDEKRKFFVDIYTTWCGWCKKMDKSTFGQSEIAQFLNDNYYPIKFDAEFKEAIQIGGKEYKFVKYGRSGYHELAKKLTNGKLSYPTFVFLDEDLRIIQIFAGYQDARIFEKIMTYFASDYHKTTPWSKYERSYVPINARPVKNPNAKN